ncbi:MAG: phage head morphogenesis protein [Blastocatellia bacterium]|nr:phage head morphogenesis protein [Blastocatellia bacterium]
MQAYGQAWQQIQLDLKQLTDQMESARAAGEVVSQAWLFQRARLQALKVQIERQINQFARDTDLLIQAEQHAAIEAARIQSLRLIQMALPFDGTQLAEAQISFTQLPNEAIQAQLGFLSNRSPLKKLLAQLGPQAATSAGDALIQAVALGYNPRKTATHLREALGGNLSRALTIARTETLRAYRESSRLQFQANADVLEGWVWISARDSRTCASCWAMHGTIHKLEERLDDHPNGRCTMVPRSKSFEELGIDGVPDTRPPLPETGEEGFAKLTPKEQDQILGIAAGKAYRAGQVKLSDFVGRKRSTQWGTMRYARSLSDAIQNAQNNAKMIPWMPSMTLKKAEEWASQSAYPVPVSHVTDIETAKKIEKEGFKLSKAGFGGTWGNGVYAATDQKTSEMYESWVRDTGKTPQKLTVLANVRKIFEHQTGLPVVMDEIESIVRTFPNGERTFNKLLDSINEANDGLLKKAFHLPTSERRDFLDRNGYIGNPYAQALVQFLEDMGYDALLVKETPISAKFGGNQILVFDPRKVIVVKK